MHMHPRHITSHGRNRGLGLFLLSLFFVALTNCRGDVTDPSNPSSGGTDPSPYDHSRVPGASARDLLANDDFERLIVEVRYVPGFRPTDAALQELETFLNDRLNKPAGIVIELSPLQIQNQPSYSANDIRALEQQHRTVYTDGSTLATFLVFLDGEFAGGANVLGIAYNNTSMVVFAEKIGQYTGGPLEPSLETVEATVANHEFGHILGLVNNGSSMQTAHQDEPNGHHCDNPDCLMHYSVRLTDFISNLLGGIPNLDQDCLDDLQANGGK